MQVELLLLEEGNHLDEKLINENEIIVYADDFFLELLDHAIENTKLAMKAELESEDFNNDFLQALSKDYDDFVNLSRYFDLRLEYLKNKHI